MKARRTIYEICADVLKITQKEIDEVRAIYEGQLMYESPLKPATTGWQHDLGEHNKNVLEALLHLKAVIEAGADIQKPKGDSYASST
ncbi:MAG: hypothetical protein NC548_48990 [Lachnospiraceae bacterium]|nr:hypothetical protein [Lachnospiraceae bacterium]